ncbi:MAG TPA: histidine kinase [Candidatus Limnocylindrales bacterium]|jgi:signal transduction histidine kinase
MEVPVPRRLVEWRFVALAALMTAVLASVIAAALEVDARVPTSYPAVSPLARVLDLAAGLGLTFAGLATLLALRGSPTGTIAILLGLQWFAADVAGWQGGPTLVRSGAMLVLPLAAPLLAHLVVVQLDSMRERPANRRALAAGYLLFISTSVLHALTWDPALDPTCWMQCAGNAFVLAPQPDLARGVEVAWMAGSLAVGLLIAWIAIPAIAARSRPARVLAAPILGPAALAAVALAGHGLLGLVGPPEVPENHVFAASYLARAAAWSALAAGIAWTTWVAWQRRHALASLAAELSDSPDPGAFQSALRRSVGDPDIEVAYWLPTYSRFVDIDGREVDPRRAGRAVSTITRNGAPVALVLHDPAVSGTRDLEEQIGSAAAVALDNERLRSEMLAQLDDLRRARAAIVETGDAARRQLERDLHDGVQQRLLAATYELQLARTAAPAGAADDRRFADAIETARRALREIRSFAQGIHPLILTEAGLAAALHTFAEEAAVPVELAVGDGERYPEPVETTAYAIATEAVQDAISRGATYCAIAARGNGGSLTLRIEDDGANREGPPITVTDRAGALGGTVATEPRAMTIELPCV